MDSGFRNEELGIGRRRFNKKTDCSICRKSTTEFVIQNHPDSETINAAVNYGVKNKFVSGTCGHIFHELCVLLNMRVYKLRKLDDVTDAPLNTPSEASGVVMDIHNRIIAEYNKAVTLFECDFGCGQFVRLGNYDTRRINTILRNVNFSRYEIRVHIEKENRPYVSEALDLGIWLHD